MNNTNSKLLHTNLEHRIWLYLLFLSLTAVSCQPENNAEVHSIDCAKSDSGMLYFPSEELGYLFAEVQLSELFPDSKTFVDCKPLHQVDSIHLWYEELRNEVNFNLALFIDSCFLCPAAAKPEKYNTVRVDIKDHLKQHWEYLTRNPFSDTLKSSLLELNMQYVIPGGRFREIYYWDSYFTMEGLAASGRAGLIENMLDNFACLVMQYGHIPNGNRTYYLSRSQPPFFAEMVKMLMRLKGDTAGIKYLPALLTEYNFWMQTNGETRYKRAVEFDGLVLNRYWDSKLTPRPESFREDYLLASELDSLKSMELYRNIRAACESGWDFSSRWLSDEMNLKTIETTNILPLDLNCLMYNMESTLASIYQLKNVADSARLFMDRSEIRKIKIQEIFWNDSLKFFVDYNLSESKRMITQTLASVYPLYFGIATEHQARKVSEALEKQFLKAGGLLTSLNNTGQQWDAPNGWAPLHWLAIVGLENYGYSKLADSVAKRWLGLNKKVYERTGKMMEKYNVEDLSLEAGGGEYPLQDGFGWTNGVYLALINKGYSP